MRIIDITAPLGAGTPTYPGDPPVEVIPLPLSDGFAVSRVTFGSHAGTHVDPPVHLLPGGRTVDELPLTTLIGPTVLAEVTLGAGGAVEPASLARLPRARRVLLRTGGAPLSEEAARLLVRRGVRLVGVDGLSVAPLTDPAPVHQILLQAGVIIVEGLALAGVTPGRYRLICLPLLLERGDGSPVRAVLIERPNRR